MVGSFSFSFNFFLSNILSRGFTMSEIKKKNLPPDPFHFALRGDLGNTEKALEQLLQKVASGEDAGYISSRRGCYEILVRWNLDRAKQALHEGDFQKMENHFKISREIDAKPGFEMRGEIWIAMRECYIAVLKKNYEVGKEIGR